MCTRLWLLENQIGVSRGQVDPLDVKWTGSGKAYVDEFNTDPIEIKYVKETNKRGKKVRSNW